MSQAQRNSRGGIRKPTGGLRRWYRIRQLAAFVLSVTMVLCNVGNSAAIALAGEGSSRIVFGMEAENIWEAAKEALEQGEVSPVPAFGEEDGAEASKYRELFGDGMLFDITQGAGYTALPDVEGVDLQMFVRIKEGADPQTYRLSGEEDLLFLYINGSSREVTASVEINGESMGTATVKPYREAFGAGEEEGAASEGASAPEGSAPVSDSGGEDVPPSDGGTENAPSSDGQTEDALPSDEGTENVPPSDENTENAPSADESTENAPSPDEETEDVPSTDKGTENAPSAEEEAGDVPPSDEGTENAPSTDEETKGTPVSDGETKTAPESDGKKGDAPKSDEGAKDIPKPDGKTENVSKPDKVTEEASAPDREAEDTQKPDGKAENTGNPSTDKDEQPSRGGQEETPDNSGTQDKADEVDHTEDKEGSGSTEDAKKHEKEEHTENTQEKGQDAGKEEGGSQDRAKDDADEGEKPESGREEEKPASGDSNNREKEISMSPNRVHTVAKAQTDSLGLVALEDGTTAKVVVISLADTGFVPEEAPEGVPEDIPAEVKAFLDAVAKIPEEITEENAEEVGTLLYGEAADALEALLGTGYEDREDVQAAMAAMEEAGKTVDEALNMGSSTLASGYTPVENVGIYPDKKPAGNTATGKVRYSNQSLTMLVGQKASFLLGAPTNTLYCGTHGYVFAEYNPSDYCDISLIDNTGQNLVGNPTYTAGNNNGTRVFDTQFEALKPGTSDDVRVCYYANFGIVFTNGANTIKLVCPYGYYGYYGHYVTINKDIKWYRYNDVFGINVKARYVLKYELESDVTPQRINPTTKDVAATTAALNVTDTVPTREGYVFKGWAETKNAEPEDAVKEITLNWEEGYGSAANPVEKTLYPIWVEDDSANPPTDPAKTYTVTYTDGVAGETVFPDQGYEGLKYGEPTPAFIGTPERKGWTFIGWKLENGDDNRELGVSEKVNPDDAKPLRDSDGNILKDDEGNILRGEEILYVAQWKKNETETPPVTYYTVIYTDGVGGEVVFADQETPNLTVGGDTPKFLIEKEDGTKVCENPTRVGYTFKGWKYTNNSGVHFVTRSAEVASRKIQAEDADENRVITYTATWEEESKPITGSLIIRKTVSGDGVTEADRETDFVFEVELKDADGKPLSGEYRYQGDKTGTIRNGKTVSLRDGQMVVIEGLPLNTEYTVWEKTDHMEGYDAGIQTGSKLEGKEGTVLGCTGTIEEAKEATVHFINRVKSEPEKPTVPENPTVPEKPTDPEKPTAPVNPTDPERPADPAEPTDSETPRPVEPGNPSKPDVPESPADNPTENPEENTAESPTETAGPEESSSQENPEETTAPTEPSRDPFVTPRPSGGGGGGGGGSARERNTSVTVSAEPSGEAAEEPTVEINPEDVPLADLPSQEQLDEVMIYDEEVPLFGLPKTGDGSIQAGVLLGMALISLLSACGIYLKKREKDE